MAYGWAKGFVIDYVPKESGKLSCRDCVYANLYDKSCKIKPVVFKEIGYSNYKACKSFQPIKGLTGNKKKEAEKILKSLEQVKRHKELEKRNQVNNGKKKKYQSKKAVKPLDRFSVSEKMIKDANKQHLFDDDNIFLEDVKASNFLELWDQKGQTNKCGWCGENLIFTTKNEIYFHINKRSASILVDGKFCSGCHCMYIVKEILLSSVREKR